MVRIETTGVISRPADEVWKFMTDFQNMPKWDIGVVEARQSSPGPIGVGSTGESIGGSRCPKQRNSYRVVEFDPNHTLTVLITEGRAKGFRASFVMESDPDWRTKFTAILEGSLTLPYKILWPLVARSVRKTIEADVRNLTSVLEPADLKRNEC